MTLTELQTKLLSLMPMEKAEAIDLLNNSLTQNCHGITKTVDVCGGSACIAGTRIPVWVLANARGLGISESMLLDDYPTLTATDLANAWLYDEVYGEEIAGEIRENTVARFYADEQFPRRVVELNRIQIYLNLEILIIPRIASFDFIALGIFASINII
jgi:uncharacterized protein (DUF433 family)